MAPLAPDFRQQRPHRASPRLPKRIPRRIWIFPWALDRKALSEAEEEELARMARLHGSSRVRQFRVQGSFADRVSEGDEMIIVATRSPKARPRSTSLIEAPSRIVNVVDSRPSRGGALLLHLSTDLAPLKLGAVRDAVIAAGGAWTTDGSFRSARVVQAIRELWSD
jgi:hypothetical protein